MSEVSPEAGGVIEVVEMAKGSKMMDSIVTIMVNLGMYKLIITMTLRMENCSKATMHL